MLGREAMASNGGGDCTWNSDAGDSENHENPTGSNSATKYSLNKGWASADNNSTPPMSKTAVANLLRQMKSFVSSDVTVERNEPGEHWGIGEGPVVKGWGHLPQQQPQPPSRPPRSQQQQPQQPQQSRQPQQQQQQPQQQQQQLRQPQPQQSRQPQQQQQQQPQQQQQQQPQQQQQQQPQQQQQQQPQQQQQQQPQQQQQQPQQQQQQQLRQPQQPQPQQSRQPQQLQQQQQPQQQQQQQQQQLRQPQQPQPQPQQSRQPQQQQQPPLTNRNNPGIANNSRTQTQLTASRQVIVSTDNNKEKPVTGWNTGAASTVSSASSWAAVRTKQFRWTSQEAATSDGQTTAGTVKPSAAKDSPRSSVLSPCSKGPVSNDAPSKISTFSQMQSSTIQTVRGSSAGVKQMCIPHLPMGSHVPQASAQKEPYVPPAKLVYGCASVQPDSPAETPKVRSPVLNTTRQAVKNICGPRISSVTSKVTGWSDPVKPEQPAAAPNPSVPSHPATLTNTASVTQPLTATETTVNESTSKVSAWGARFTPTAQCKPEALRRWTESPPPPIAAPPISPGGEPNKMVYVSKWLHDQSTDGVPSAPVPVTTPPAMTMEKTNSAKRNTPQFSSPRTGVATAQLYSNPKIATNYDLHQMSNSAAGLSPKRPVAAPPPPPSLLPITSVEPCESYESSGIVIVQSKEQKLIVLRGLVQKGLQVKEQLSPTYIGVARATSDHSTQGSAASFGRILIVVDNRFWDPEGIRTWLSICGLMRESDVQIATTQELSEGGCASYRVLFLINFDVLACLEEYARRLRLLDDNGVMKTLFDPATESESARALASQLTKCGLPVPQEFRQLCFETPSQWSPAAI